MPRKESNARREYREGSLFEDKAKGLWFGAASVSVNGKRRRRKTVGVKSKSEARTRLRQLKIELAERRTSMQPDNQRVGAYVKTWLDGLTLAPSTVLRYRSLFAKHVEKHDVSAVKLSEVDSPHVTALYADLRKAGQSESTVKKTHALLHSAFEAKRFTKNGANFRNPCDLPKNAKPKYKPEKGGHPFDPDKEAAFLAAVDGDKWEAMYVLALDSGMRQGELFALEWRDINCKADTVEVCQTLKDGDAGLVVGETKGKARRSIRLSPTTVTALENHRLLQSRATGLQPLVFPDQVGGYLRRQNFDRKEGRAGFSSALRKAAAQSGLAFADHTFHDLRHTMATLLLNDGESFMRVSQRQGHKTVAITLGTYAHCIPQDEDRPAARFEQRRKRPTGASVVH